MIATISTTFNVTPKILWREIVKPKSLRFVSAPILYFFPTDNTDLSKDWQINREYNFKSYFLKIIPLGEHKVILNKIDIVSNEIISNESIGLIKVWNHTINFNAINSRQIEYTDTIEIKAGLLTFFIWLFSHIFYRHRHKRWKILLRSKN